MSHVVVLSHEHHDVQVCYFGSELDLSISANRCMRNIHESSAVLLACEWPDPDLAWWFRMQHACRTIGASQLGTALTRGSAVDLQLT